MINFIQEVKDQFNLMIRNKQQLFRANIKGSDLYIKYLSKLNGDAQFRDPKSTTHTCNSCSNWFSRYANIVTIDEDLNIVTLFDNVTDDFYAEAAKALSETIKESGIYTTFVETYQNLNSLPYEQCKKSQESFLLGVPANHKMYDASTDGNGYINKRGVFTFNHLHLDLPTYYVDQSNESIASIIGAYDAKYQVFSRMINEINLDTLELVRDLINQGSLLNAESYKSQLQYMIDVYNSKPENANNTWIHSTVAPMPVALAKFKNTLMGVLCTELAEGLDLQQACLNWNKRADPANYMKAKAPFTARQLKDAEEFVVSNGYSQSFDRKIAALDDIYTSEILHMNSEGQFSNITVFSGLKPTKKSQHSRAKIDNIEDVVIDKFMKDILPNCTSVELLLENHFNNNMVTLTTAKQKESKNMFKWDNNFSWTFNGNLAGKSEIKDAVQSHGGKTNGVLRFSIMWAEGNGDNSDLDAHCLLPSARRISYKGKLDNVTKGNLDIDIQNPNSHIQNGKKVVENITFPSLSLMKNGDYKFDVHQYSARNSQGFKAEIEFDGQTHLYEYVGAVRGHNDVAVVTVKDGQMSIRHIMTPIASFGGEIWGLDVDEFHKVNLVCNSPNHWGDNAIGNKHYLFMLDGCKNPNSVRSFHNENLNNELRDYRKVLEVLGAKTMIEPGNSGLNGVGFNATVRDSVTLRCRGSFNRIINVKI